MNVILIVIIIECDDGKGYGAVVAARMLDNGFEYVVD